MIMNIVILKEKKLCKLINVAIYPLILVKLDFYSVSQSPIVYQTRKKLENLFELF